MKKTFSLIVLSACLAGTAFLSAEEPVLKGTITLSGAWAIYPTAVAWAEAFQKKYPGVKIEVSAGGAGKGASDAINGLVDIGMVSRDPDPAETAKGIVPVSVLHDAVFPVVSVKNPVLKNLMAEGIKRQEWKDIYISGMIVTWDAVGGNGAAGKKIHIYTRSDSCGAASAWAGYLGKKQEDLKGIGIYSDPGLLEAVRRDPLGLGYNNFSYVFTRDGALVAGVKLVPIDSNANGKADPEEIISTRDDAVKAIRSGKYPAGRKNYFFVRKNLSPLAREFIRFALSEEGSRIVDETGTSLPLTGPERTASLQKLP